MLARGAEPTEPGQQRRTVHLGFGGQAKFSRSGGARLLEPPEKFGGVK